MKTLYLVDVSSMYFRAYYAIRPLTNKAGLPTNALYGFMSMAVKLLKEVQPDYMAFCFDLKEPSFRKEIYSEYKANRTEMPEDLVPQVPYVKKLSAALGVPLFEKPGFEADDLIGSLTAYGRKHNLEVVIVSGDKDFAQLVAPFVSMYDTMKEAKYDPQGVVEKWGVEPSQVIDYLSLTGDSSDNIPGVRGIGPKGAQKLLAEFKTLENIYANLDKIKNPSLRTKLENGKEDALLSKRLVAIKSDIDLGIKLEDLKLKPIPEAQMHALLEELDFKSFERRLFGNSKPPEQKTESATAMVETTTQPDQGSFVFSAEGNDIELEPDQIKSTFKSGEEVYGFLSDRGVYIANAKAVYRLKGHIHEFSEGINSLNLKWKGFDLKEFWQTLELEKPQLEWDSALAAYVIRAGEVGTFAETLQKFTGIGHPELANGQQLYECHLKLEKALQERLQQLHGERVLRDLDLPLEPILYGMERRGILLDSDELKRQSKEIEKNLKNLETEIYKQTGETFNLTSPKQLGEVLFNKLKMPVIRKTKTGISTDYDVLLKLSKDYPVCLLIIEYRELSKLKSTYLDALPLLVNPKTNRLHTHFNQTVTTTGRLSSTNPNLQNIPIRTPRGQQVRQAFIVSKNNVLVSADYSQIELRILAHITEDPGLVSAFEADLDIHAATAAEVFDIKVKDVTADQRRVAKAVNFGIAYGMSPYGLSENLYIPVEEASEIIKKYFSRFKKVRDYMEDTIEIAKRQGYVETIFGRRRYLDELKSKNGNIRKFGERAAINAPMQGTAADIVKKAMIEVDSVVPETMLLQVHDELVFEISKAKVEESVEKIKSAMESVVTLKVPLKVNVATGPNWDAAH